MPAATASSSSYQARNREAVMASQFSRTQQSARSTRRANRDPGASRTSSPRITGAGVSTRPVRSTSLALPESSRQSTWQQTQHEAQRSTMAPPIPDEVNAMTEETPEVTLDPGYAEAQGDYAADYRAAAAGGGIGGKMAQAREMTQAAEKMKKKIEQIQKAIKMAKQVKDQLFRVYRYGSEVEFEHAAGGSFFWPANFGTVFVVVKTLIKPSATLKTAIGKAGKDEGQFLKGFLSFLEPDVLDAKNPMAWIDFGAALLIVFVAWQVFIYMNMAFVVVGALALAVGGFAELLGDLGSFLSSFF